MTRSVLNRLAAASKELEVQPVVSTAENSRVAAIQKAADEAAMGASPSIPEHVVRYAENASIEITKNLKFIAEKQAKGKTNEAAAPAQAEPSPVAPSVEVMEGIVAASEQRTLEEIAADQARLKAQSDEANAAAYEQQRQSRPVPKVANKRQQKTQKEQACMDAVLKAAGGLDAFLSKEKNDE